MPEPDPVNRKGETFFSWLRQAKRLPETGILESVADPRWTIQLRWAWVSCEPASKFLRKPIRFISYKMESLLAAFDRGEIGEQCLSILMAHYVRDQFETRRLFF